MRLEHRVRIHEVISEDLTSSAPKALVVFQIDTDIYQHAGFLGWLSGREELVSSTSQKLRLLRDRHEWWQLQGDQVTDVATWVPLNCGHSIYFEKFSKPWSLYLGTKKAQNSLQQLLGA